jgi:hypothetical protein
MVQRIRIYGYIRVLVGWFYCKSMFFVFHDVFGGGLARRCISVPGYFLYHHILIKLFCYSSCRCSLVVCYWRGLFYFFL